MSKAHAVVARNTCTITLHYPTLHHTTQHHTTPDHTTPYHTTTTIAATTATTIAKYKYTTLHYVTLLTLQYSTTTATAALHHTTSSSCGWGDRCNHCSHSKKYSSNLNHVDSLCHPCVSQQFTSRIVSYIMKLSPPPCAALLAKHVSSCHVMLYQPLDDVFAMLQLSTCLTCNIHVSIIPMDCMKVGYDCENERPSHRNDEIWGKWWKST